MTETYKVSSHIAWRRVEDEVVVLDLNTSVYYSLNDVGARMWELLAESLPVEKVAENVAEEYEVGDKTVGKDIQSFLKDLCKEKLLVKAN